MLIASLPRVSGSPSSHEGPQLGKDVGPPPWDQEADILGLGEENSTEQWIQEAQGQFSWGKPCGHLLR